MVMQMYKSWAQRRGYDVSVVDEMPGETVGIKVRTYAFSSLILFCDNMHALHHIYYPRELGIWDIIYKITHRILLCMDYR